MRQGTGGTSSLTDEQILEMEPGASDGKASSGDATRLSTRLSSGRGSRRDDDAHILDGEATAGEAAGEASGAIDNRGHLSGRRADEGRENPGASADEKARTAEKNGENAGVNDDADDGTNPATEGAADGAADADEPAWVATLEAQPAAAAEARRWHAAANDVAALDAAYFSADPGARSGLAGRLYESDPAAFREMLAASARTLAARDPQALADLARELGVPVAPQAQATSKSVSQAARAATPGDGARRPQRDAESHGHSNVNAAVHAHTGARDAAAHDTAANDGKTFPAEAYRAFEATTNDDVARKMHEAIDRSLTSALPEGMAAGTRRRIGEDIFREVHAALSGDRELARQVGETLRDWRFDASARQQVVSLVSARARAVLPAVARRVVAEWTSSVLASDRAKTARIDAAASRRDITGGRLPEPVAGSARRSRDVDYRRMSDQQILDI